MNAQPIITTARLVLRPFRQSDANRVQALAGAKEIAAVTTVPHPYEDGMAESWISGNAEAWLNGEGVAYAITCKDSGELLGCVSVINMNSTRPELGYWVGLDYWGKGSCTEASEALLEFVLHGLDKPIIFARHLCRNPASGRVLEKCGLRYIETVIEREGRMKGDSVKVYVRHATWHKRDGA